MTGSPGSSQPWVRTRAAWFNLISDKKQQASGTPPRSTSTPHNIINSSTQGLRSTAAVRGEICFHFSTFSGREDHTNAPLFPPLLLTRLNLFALSSAAVSFSSVHTHSRGSLVTASHYYPETAARLSHTGSVPSDTTRVPTLPRRAACKANRIKRPAQFLSDVKKTCKQRKWLPTGGCH